MFSSTEIKQTGACDKRLYNTIEYNVTLLDKRCDFAFHGTMNSFVPRVVLAAAVATLINLFLGISPVSAISADDQVARDTAQHWLSLLDSSNYKQAYAALTPRRRTTLSEDNVVGFARARRMPLGRARSRSLLESKRTRKLIGNPNGEYEDVAFKTSFEHKAEAVERVVLTKETGTWQVLAYKIY